MFTMDNLTYIIDAEGVKIFEEGQDVPFLLQPNWADGDAWEEGEAESWAAQKVLELTDPTADLAGSNRDNHPRPRPEVLPE